MASSFNIKKNKFFCIAHIINYNTLLVHFIILHISFYMKENLKWNTYIGRILSLKVEILKFW